MPLWKEANNLGQAVHNGFGPWTALLTGTVLFTSFALLENLVGLGESLGLLGLALHALGERQSRRASIQVAIRPLHLRPFPSRLHFELSQQQPEPWVLQMLPPEPTTYLSLGAAEKARLN